MVTVIYELRCIVGAFKGRIDISVLHVLIFRHEIRSPYGLPCQRFRTILDQNKSTWRNPAVFYNSI